MGDFLLFKKMRNLFNNIQLKTGDKIIISKRNLNRYKSDFSAFGGIKGIVGEIYDNKGFILITKSSSIVIPKTKKGIWLIKNNKEFFYRF